MNYKEYKQMVIETEKGSLTKYPKILHAIMGMNGEAGECIDILKKHMFQGHELDVDHLLSELGDVCWYTMLLINELDIDVDHVFEYTERLVHVKQWKDKPCEMGLSNILNINLNCGKVIDVYYDSIGNPTTTMLIPLRFIFYNIQRAANIFDKTLEDIFDINREKIKQRYPDGFSSEMSVNRDDSIVTFSRANDSNWMMKPGEKCYE